MKKQIAIITLGILMLAGAMAMYAGESETFVTNLTNPVYTVTGNSSSLEGMNVTFENGNITISLALNYKPDNFTIVFFDEITREVVRTVYGSGGSSGRTSYVDRNVTIYVPEYINTTEMVEVEKIVDNTTVVEEGYAWWQMALSLVAGLGFGCFIMACIKSSKHKEDSEENMQ